MDRLVELQNNLTGLRASFEAEQGGSAKAALGREIRATVAEIAELERAAGAQRDGVDELARKRGARQPGTQRRASAGRQRR